MIFIHVKKLPIVRIVIFFFFSSLTPHALQKQAGDIDLSEMLLVDF